MSALELSKGGTMNDVSVEYPRAGDRGDRREVPDDVLPAAGPDRVGRFSDGLESHTHEGQDLRIGRFSDGLEQHSYEGQNRRIGRFSDGLESIRRVRLKVGRFSEGIEQRPRLAPAAVADLTLEPTHPMEVSQ